MARRTFKQLKEGIDTKKGQLWQEKCDDGDQDYMMLEPHLWKMPEVNSYARNLERKEVEEQSDWFVEVFQVIPEYATKEEIKKMKAKKVI